jgi:mannose-1-phosphate guanylyltransferase/mannose-6-phosphate isomerase
MLVPVILSGGAGTRLWPVSRSAYPKPFMQLGDGDTLLGRTLERALAVAGDGPVLTVTARDFYFLTRDEYARHHAAGRLAFLLEPTARNTAPAVLLAALHVAQEFGRDACLLVLPADHLISNVDAFVADTRHAQALAADGWLVTFGIRPSAPETGFGYIHVGDAISGHDGLAVRAYVEKPDRATAEAYDAGGDHLWNAGVFCFGAGALLDAAADACPDVLAAVRTCHASARSNGDAVEYDRDAFLAQPDISIDYAVMEHAARVAVVQAGFDWSDIGSWKAVSEHAGGNQADAAGNRVSGPAVLVDSSNCYVQTDGRLVAAVGVDDLVIVDAGDAVLVAHRERAQDVKRVVEQLRADNHAAATFHQTVHRPWGSYTVLEDRDDCKVKRLTVKPGEVLSLQLHHRRSEHWTVVDGTARVRIGERETLLERNQSAYIPMGTLHRLENPTDRDIHLIEVQCGDYFGEDDIVRLEDRYGRTTADAAKS